MKCKKIALAEANVIKLEEDSKAAAIREEKLEKKIFFLEEQLHEVEDAKIIAEYKWLSVGLNRRLDMVKAANLDYKKCMFMYELRSN